MFSLASLAEVLLPNHPRPTSMNMKAYHRSWNRLVGVGALFFLVSGGTAESQTSGASAHPRPLSINSLRVHYIPPSSPALQSIAREAAEDSMLEDAVGRLNRMLRLPLPVDVYARECGSPTSFYVPATRSVVVCYELLEKRRATIEGDAQSSDPVESALYFGRFVTVHEIGHAVISELALPVLGRAEDAADQFATWWYLIANEPAPVVSTQLALTDDALAEEDRPLGDTHEPPVERVLNLECWLYAEGVVPTPSSLLPEQRRTQCGSEWKGIQSSWFRLLRPYLLIKSSKSSS